MSVCKRAKGIGLTSFDRAKVNFTRDFHTHKDKGGYAGFFFSDFRAVFSICVVGWV